MKKRSLVITTLMMLFGSFSITAHAAIFLKLDETIEGNVTQDGFRDQVELESWGWAVMGDAKGLLECPQKIEVSKHFDKASMKLAQAAATAKFFPDAELSITGPSGSGKGDVVVLNFKLREVSINDYEIIGGDGIVANLFEKFTIEFRQILVEQRDNTAQGYKFPELPPVVANYEVDLVKLGSCPSF